MPTGTVKWFNNAKGFGFILPEDGGSDLFAHYSSIEMEGYKTLKAGQVVTFDIVTTDKGGHAKNIRVLETVGQPLHTQQNSMDASSLTASHA
jgi:CspA family cold shock protein